jgi:aminoglycoside phosphotransferase (APT) family kinase protein
MTGATEGDELARALETVLGVAGGHVTGLRRLSGGASRETWSFDAVQPSGRTEPLILRRDPPGAPRTGMAMEARLLKAAASAGVAVPRVLVVSDDADVVGSSFLIMERIDGETIPRRILRDDAYAAARPQLAGQCGRILARIHAIDPAAFADLPAEDPVGDYRTHVDALAQPHPAFELGLRWLEARRPPPSPSRVVHGDFRNGNLIVGPDGVRAVLDWELAHRGDPIEDLGWLCVRAWRFGVADRRVGGFGDVDDLVAAYEDQSETLVDRDALEWWEAMGTLKWGVMCIIQAATHTAGLVRSVELAAIGRRVCENERDLLDLLPAPWSGR